MAYFSYVESVRSYSTSARNIDVCRIGAEVEKIWGTGAAVGRCWNASLKLPKKIVHYAYTFWEDRTKEGGAAQLAHHSQQSESPVWCHWRRRKSSQRSSARPCQPVEKTTLA